MSANRCNGIVTGNLAGIASMIEYAHEDGSICARPGPKNSPVGSLVESTFDIFYGLCEHTIFKVHEFAPESEPEPEVTVQSIVLAATAKMKPVEEDAPVDAATIERAKVPPKIRVDLVTSPAAIKAAAMLPTEQRYEYDLNEDELAELNAVHRTDDEPVDGGAPVSPFSSTFDPRPSAPARKGPVSVFDLK